MNVRRYLFTSVVVHAVALAPGYAGGQGSDVHAEDRRERITLEASARNQVLAEMRMMLASLHRILAALAENDLAAAGEAARASGVATAVDLAPQVREHLPENFRALGMATHRGFDEIANRIAEDATQRDVQRRLATLTSNCVACHETYRLDEIR